VSGIAQCLIGVALGSYFLMTNWSFFIWDHARPLWGLQFPWRLNVVLGIATTGLVALATEDLLEQRIGYRSAIAGLWVLVALGSIRAAGSERYFLHTFPTPALRVGSADNIPGYEPVTREPTAEDYELPPSSDGFVDVTTGTGTAHGKLLQPRQIAVDANCQTPCTLLVRQLAYPEWKARTTTGQELPITLASEAGLMQVHLPAGDTTVRLEMPKDQAEVLAPWVTCFSVLTTLVLFSFSERRLHN
jgi:hypothetical protein